MSLPDLHALFGKLLEPYQERFRKALENDLSSFGSDNPLLHACRYACESGGKRLRPALVYMIADALGKNTNVDSAALAVEYFHTSSLIADDLPCMDNDSERRGKPTCHIVYGETTALLASYGLIAAGFGHLAKNGEAIRSQQKALDTPIGELVAQALSLASLEMGNEGLIGGQWLDLYAPNDTPESFLIMVRMKTVALFALSFALGWLFGGGSPSRIQEVQEAAYHFGVAFQLLDDLDDMKQDAASERAVNYALKFGVEATSKAIAQHLALFAQSLEQLNLQGSPLYKLTQLAP